MYSWQELKDCFIDRNNNPLEAKLQRSYLVDAVLLIILLIVSTILSLNGLEDSSAYRFFDRMGLIFFAFLIADFLSYKTVKNYNEYNKKEKLLVQNKA